MENATKYLIYAFVGVLLVVGKGSGQGFMGIVPLQSDCEAVKQGLNVTECSYPVSTYKLDRYTISIWFTKERPDKKDAICWKVPARTVTSILVSYNRSMALADFEHPLKFVKGPTDDIFTMVYENEEKALTAHVIKGYIQEVIYMAAKEDRDRLAYSCRSADAGDVGELPSMWIDRYWELSRKLEAERLRLIVHIFNESPIYREIYIIYYFTNERDRASGIKQATRAKSDLEKQGIAAAKIKIINGGKEEKAELVIYFKRDG